ncbi:MAG: excinuclease ABC subunit A, partial [Planctomycetota bacterium]|nr:excinuclease ABC subunit A [Planctomycetota bacterium]
MSSEVPPHTDLSRREYLIQPQQLSATKKSMGRYISLRGVAVHNLDAIDLDIPHQQLVVLCGLSGSGKSSLAMDTLYAEGQRRYIESFSAYTRQFLERLDKPEADRIDGIPPAIAVTAKGTNRSSRATVGTATEAADYLRLLFAKIGKVVCGECGQEVNRDSPQSAARTLTSLPAGTRYMIAFRLTMPEQLEAQQAAAWLKEDGFHRVIVDERMVDLSSQELPLPRATDDGRPGSLYVVLDRLKSGGADGNGGAGEERVRDSLEAAFAKGKGQCCAFVVGNEEMGSQDSNGGYMIDGRPWRRLGFSTQLMCDRCEIEYPAPEPRLYSFNSPLGACPTCEGFGNVIDMDMDLIVPDPHKSIREGAIAPWNTPAYTHELEALMTLADEHDIEVDEPFSSLDERQLKLIEEGLPDTDFSGLGGFFAWLERRKYKMHIRVFLSRWRSYRLCPDCRGARLRPEALATRVGDHNIAHIAAMKIRDAAEFFARLQLSDYQRQVSRTMLEQVSARLKYLEQVGLGYLTLDRTMRTLSGGETRRVALT